MMQFIAEIPADAGRVSLCEFRGMVVIASESGRAWVAQRQPDGSYRVTEILCDLPPQQPGTP